MRIDLLGCEDRYGREYAERVGRQEDNIIRGRAGGDGVDVLGDLFDMLDRIRHTGVLGHALVGKVDLAVRVHGDVLEQRVSLDSVVDVRLALLVKTDDLCIAAALKVEDTVIVPAVLVVADQQSLGVGRKGGLAGTGKSEEDGGVLAFHIGVGGAVHGSNALQRQVVVHHGEQTLLHLAAVPGVENDLLAALDVEHRGSLRVQTQLLVVLDLCLGSVVAYKVRLKALQLLSGGLDEHVLDKVRLPGDLHDKANCHTGVLVGAAEAVYHIELFAGELLDSQLFAGCPGFFGSRMVVVGIFGRCPPYGVLAHVIHHDEFVFGRTAGVDTGHHVHSTQLSLLTLIKALKSGIGLVREKLLVRGIVDDLCYVVNTVFG